MAKQRSQPSEILRIEQNKDVDNFVMRNLRKICGHRGESTKQDYGA